MIDVLGTIQKAKLARAENFISIIELFDYVKKSNVTASFSDIADYFFITLAGNNPRKSENYDHYGNPTFEMIDTYFLPIDLDEQATDAYIDFFDVIGNVKSRYTNYIDDPFLLEHDKPLDETKADEFIDTSYKELFISRKQIEQLLGVTIPLDNRLAESYKKERLLYLTGEITKLDDNYFSVPKYNDLQTLKETSSAQTQRITELKQQLTEEQANNADEIAELKSIIQQQADTIAQLEESLKNAELQSIATEDKQRRTSQPQKAIFTLLTLKNYPNCQSRNELFNLINADLKANGIITSDIRYPTLDRLIDEDIRLGEGIKKSPFPPKQK